MKRAVFVMVDGMGDVSFPILKGNLSEWCDPFSLISSPNISKYFLSDQNGFFGSMDPVEPGLACGSDTAHLSIFGYDPKVCYSGRGAFETLGAGVDLMSGDVAFKCNFAHFKPESKEVVLRQVDKSFSSEASVLCRHLNDQLNRPDSWIVKAKLQVSVHHATEHRCVIRIRSYDGPLSDKISGTDPLKDNRKLISCSSLDGNQLSAQTSQIVQKLSDEIISLLSDHEINISRANRCLPTANIVLFRGCASFQSLPDLKSRWNLISDPIMFARTCVISGIGRSLGFVLCPTEPVDEEDKATIRKDLKSFMEFWKSRPDCQFSFFHIKIVDEASHDGNIQAKMELLEFVDELVGELSDCLKDFFRNDESRIILTGDHTTACRVGEHSCEPVPFLVSGAISGQAKESNDSSRKISCCFSGNNIGRFTGSGVCKFIRGFL